MTVTGRGVGPRYIYTMGPKSYTFRGFYGKNNLVFRWPKPLLSIGFGGSYNICIYIFARHQRVAKMRNPEVYKASMKEIASVVIKSPAWTTTLASRPPKNSRKNRVKLSCQVFLCQIMWGFFGLKLQKRFGKFEA